MTDGGTNPPRPIPPSKTGASPGTRLFPTEFKGPAAPGSFSFFEYKDEEDDDLVEDTCPLLSPHDGARQSQLESDIEACQKKVGVKSCAQCTNWPYGRLAS
jgi:hypothetical protein